MSYRNLEKPHVDYNREPNDSCHIGMGHQIAMITILDLLQAALSNSLGCLRQYHTAYSSDILHFA